MVRCRFAMVATAVALFLSGCQSPPSTPSSQSTPGGGGATGAVPPGGKGVEIVFWHTQTQQNKTALEDLCRRFTAQNSQGITVRPIYQGDYTQTFQKIVAGITAHSLPDIAVSYESMVAEYMKAGVVVPLDPYATGPEGLSKADLDDIFPAFLNTNRYRQYGNRMLSFPFTKSLLVNYVNADELSRAGVVRPPIAWPDFLKAAKAMTHPAQGARPAMKGLAINVDPSTIDGWIMAQGGTLYDESGAHFDTPAAHAVFEGIASLVKAGAAYQTHNFDYQSDFGGQRAGMVCVSSTPRLLFKPMIASKFKWHLSLVPQKDPAHPKTVLYGANLCVFKSTPEKQKAAWTFIKWLSAREQAADWAVHSSYMPLRKSVAQDPQMQAAWKSDPQGKEAFDLIKYAQPEPNVRGWQEVRTALGEALGSVISGTATPDGALKDLQSKANKILAEKKA